ncbi:PKD domain-containing protein, partial [Methanococcoides seepicolus]
QDLNGDGYVDGILQNTFNPGTKDPKDFGYYFFQGTSMAAPHVSGVAALLISQGVSNGEVRTALESTAKDLGTAGWDDRYGYGLIDAQAALDSINITPVENVAPTASIGGPYSGVVGTPIQLYGSGSTDPDGTVVSYYWDFGDENSSSAINPTHAYGSVGNYEVYLTITDDDLATDTASATVTITNATDPLENTISIDSVDIITRNAGKNLFVSAKAVVT